MENKTNASFGSMRFANTHLKVWRASKCLIELYLKKYIISTNCKTGPKEILASGNYGTLINVGDFYNLKNKIEYFYYNRNKKKIRNKIKSGFKSIHRFDYKKNFKKFENIIKKHLYLKLKKKI